MTVENSYLNYIANWQESNCVQSHYFWIFSVSLFLTSSDKITETVFSTGCARTLKHKSCVRIKDILNENMKEQWMERG